MKKNKRFSGILVKCNDKVLLCKRSNDNTLPGVWSIPGGGIEDGESPEDAARREFYEETNLEVNGNLDLVGFIDRYNKDGTYLKGFMYVYSLEVDEEIYPDLQKKIRNAQTICSLVLSLRKKEKIKRAKPPRRKGLRQSNRAHHNFFASLRLPTAGRALRE